MQIKLFPIFFVLFFFVLQSHSAFGQTENTGDKKSYLTKSQITEAEKIKVFNNLCEIVNRSYFDSTFNGNNWGKLKEIYYPQVLAARNKIELRQVLNKFINELKTSHLSVSFEISLSGKTLKDIFGEKVDHKRNSILFGYGYTTAKFDNQTVVTEVLKNSAAEQAGLKPGWIEKSCQSHPLTKTYGDSVAFTETADCIFSTETEPNKVLTLSQGWFLSPHSNTQQISRILNNDILFIKFKQFNKNSGKWLNQQITENPSAKAVIIDLRGNYGGLVSELKECLSIFFPSGTVVGEFVERDLDEKNLKVGSDKHYTGQVIVLIDGNSYSGAEIFASAMQEAKRGKVVGQKSAGQVLNSIDKNLSNGFKLRLAFRDYKTVKGIRLEGKGVTPDVEIPFSIEDFRRQRDIILEKTLETLKN